jgi:hypothetical protein
MASVGSGLPSHKSTIVKQLMSNGIKAIFIHGHTKQKHLSK